MCMGNLTYVLNCFFLYLENIQTRFVGFFFYKDIKFNLIAVSNRPFFTFMNNVQNMNYFNAKRCF